MHPFAVLLARLALSTVWGLAAVAKLTQAEPRGAAVAEFGLLPRRAADAVGAALPWVELALGVLLFVGKWPALAAAASAFLLVVFSIAIIANLSRGRRIECHCFGQLGRTQISWLTVVRNAGLLAAALVIVLGPSDYLAVDGWLNGNALLPTDPPVIEFIPVLLLAVAGLLIWTLGAAAWGVAEAVGKAESGPAFGLPEYRYLRRWVGRDTSANTVQEGG